MRAVAAVLPVAALPIAAPPPARSEHREHEAKATGPCPAALLEARQRVRTRLPLRPAAARARLREVLGMLVASEVDGVGISDLADTIGYEVAQARDPEDAAVLRERGGRPGGDAWLVRLGSRSRILIELEDAAADADTLAQACELFRRTDARALSVGSPVAIATLRKALPDATIARLEPPARAR